MHTEKVVKTIEFQIENKLKLPQKAPTKMENYYNYKLFAKLF